MTGPTPASAETRPGLAARAAAARRDDVAWSFRRSAMAIASSIVLASCLGAALAAIGSRAPGVPVRL